MFFQFKTVPEDFIVEEVLHDEPQGEGEVLYLFFEKRAQTTMEIVEFLGKTCGISREEIGIAGLKDKDGITRQWITVYQSVLQRIGGEEILCQNLAKKGKLLTKTRGKIPLKVGTNRGNCFQIRLRMKTSFSEDQQKRIHQNLEKIQKNGFPNCFGSQRFGKRNKNFIEAKKILFEKNEKDQYHLRFMLQAFASMYFNEYAMTRRKKSQFLLDGDLVVNSYSAVKSQVGVYHNQKIHLFDYKKEKEEKSDSPFFEPDFFQEEIPFIPEKWIPTGPMIGRNLLLPPQETKARIHENLRLQSLSFQKKQEEICKTYQLRGIRRPLRVYPSDFSYSFSEKEILLSFFLPTGSYATTLLSFLFEGIDPQTLKENRLEIPLIK